MLYGCVVVRAQVVLSQPSVAYLLANGPTTVQTSFNASTGIILEQTKTQFRTLVSAFLWFRNVLRAPTWSLIVLLRLVWQSKVQGIVLMSVIMLFDIILLTAVVPIVRQIEDNKDRILKVWNCNCSVCMRVMHS